MQTSVIKPQVRYSEAFKLQVVRELEQGELNFGEVKAKYGIGGGDTLRRWLGRYGSGKIGKVIRVEKPEETNQVEALKRAGAAFGEGPGGRQH